MDILSPGFEDAVRSKFGIDSDDISDEELNQPFVVDVAEAMIKRRVPEYYLITDPVELLFLQEAVIYYICYSLCPSMPKRLDLKIASDSIRLEKERVDWTAQALDFLNKIEMALKGITSVEVRDTYDLSDTNSMKGWVGLIRNTRKPIGG